MHKFCLCFPLFQFLLSHSLFFILATDAKSEQDTFNVHCPSFPTKTEPFESVTQYCTCKLSKAKLGDFDIRCDFKHQKNIILTDSLFNLTKWRPIKAYLKLTNCLSLFMATSFLESWLHYPAIAMDFLSCGTVEIESPSLRTKIPNYYVDSYIGVAFFNSNISSIPSYFIRDRNKAAFMFKNCFVGTIEKEMLHNIKEIRYLVFEKSKIGLIQGPISSSGVVQLSTNSNHSFKGFQILNSTIDKIGALAFNVVHKNDIEKFVIQESTFGQLERKAFSVEGNIDVEIANNSFKSMATQALKLDVSGSIVFTSNNIQSFSEESLKSIECQGVRNFTVAKNTFCVPRTGSSTVSVRTFFRAGCAIGQVNYLHYIKAPTAKPMVHNHGATISIVVILIVCISSGGITLAWRKGLLRRIIYRMQDAPLCPEEEPPAVVSL